LAALKDGAILVFGAHLVACWYAVHAMDGDIGAVVASS